MKKQLSWQSKRIILQTSLVATLSLLMACERTPLDLDLSVADYRDRMLVEHQSEAAQHSFTAEPVAYRTSQTADAEDQRRSLLTGPMTTTQPAPRELLSEVPDPSNARDVFAARLERLREQQAGRPDQRVVRNYTRVHDKANEYLDLVQLPDQVRLSLAECVQRALNHNYAIRIEAHTPAISQTQIVEAEAAFDVEFFLDTNWSKIDQATAQTFAAGSSDIRSIEGGFRQLLPSGMQATVSLAQTRNKNNLPAEFQSLNPVYDSSFVTSLRQPLLRGFGLDINRATINVRTAEHRISTEQFIQQVRDTLLDVETAYWNLSVARRTVSVLAESVAQNWVTWQNMIERLDHDATLVEVANSESRWQSRYVEYLEAVKTVRDTEDRLKNLINDPDFLLSDPIEIIPVTEPLVAPLMVDHFAEVRTALDRRSELTAAREQIEIARIQSAVAKNNLLPRLDLNFQYEVQGIGDTSDNSFDNLTTNRFISYTLGASFSYNFGERAARAALRRANLQESQAIVSLNQITDAIVEEVNTTIRTLIVRYTQVPPQFDAVQAAELNLRALQARTQRIDPSYLQTELGAVEQLANSRTRLARLLVDYNIALVQLEKAKGTLLDYNNIVVSDVSSER